MSLFPLSRPVVRPLSLTAISVVLVSVSLSWASRQQAGSPSFNSARNHSAQALFADKGAITPDATIITVNSLSDAVNSTDGLCTLREAVTAANTNAASGASAGECVAGSSSGADVITFSIAGTINLNGSPVPTITSDMMITGPGSSQLIIHRNTGNQYRVMNIDSGTVSLSGLTVTGGSPPVGASGGGISNLGTLTMTDVTVTANETTNSPGGGIFNQGNLTMTNCSVTANTTGPRFGAAFGTDGGGIVNSGTLTMTDCVVSGNRTGSAANNGISAGSGGGIYNTGAMTLNRATISNNITGNSNDPTGSAGDGAGIYHSGGSTASLINCTVSGNTTGSGPGSGGRGGAIYNNGGAVINLTNSTISGNSALSASGISNQGTAQLTSCTVTNNLASSGANGIANNGSVNVRNTIVAGNAAPDLSGPGASGGFASLGHNLIGDPGTTNGISNGVNGDQVGVNPQLAALANNGGPTLTHALLSNSPALDAGDNCVVDVAHCGDANISQLTTDQRGPGFSRQVDGPDGDATSTVDIGAYEMQTPLASLPDTSTNEDTQLVIAFDGGDTSTITSVTATSSDAGVVPNDSAHLSVVMTGSTGALTINPAANVSGPTNITVTINRTGGPESRTFLLTVNPVNDVPSFTKGVNQTVLEDAGAQTVNGWATSISAGPADESSQILTFQITGDTNASLFSAGPAVSSTGTLTYTPAANANGSATITLVIKDDGGTANGGVDTSASQTFTITVNGINDAPSFTKGPDKTVNEDSGSQTFAAWATGISAGPSDESGQTLTFQVTNNTNAALFSAGPTVNSSGQLSFTPATNANGSATITINVKDNGGTANGGVDTSASQSFVVTVTAVNDVPSFTKGANQTVLEDAGAQTVNGWATSISAGPADESSQILTFQITGNTNASLFSAGPAVSSTGTLTYTPAANANGSATITVNLKDDGGTANGGVDTSASQTFTITVNAVNDVPSFTKGVDQTVNNNAGAQTVANWATNISAGPANESGQTLTFQVTGNTNPGLFTVGPAVSSTGTLSYTPSSSGGGSATITINLKDNGGTANGGMDTSASQTFTITVMPVGGFVSFASSSANTTENSGSTTVNVTRSGDTSKAVTVNYATNADAGVPCSTANGVASPKCDFTAALGALNFAAGDTSKSITILISQDSFVEGPETITVTLSNPTSGAALGTLSSMTVTIADDATEPPTNIIDDANMFVRMHYHDFLNREGDQSGLDFWTGQMTNCGSSDLTVCRVNVSGAFFLSIEFQQTGYLVERMYKTAYGDATATSTFGGSHQIFVPVVRANEFLTDTQRISRGVVVLQPGWEMVLENNKQAYAGEFVATSRFLAALPTTMTPTQFVDKLNQNAGNVLSASERTTAINLFGNAADTTNVNARAQALRQVAEDVDLYNAEFNRAFVLTEYIGYLRRNPNDAPEPTLHYTGYDFWLNKLNQFNGDYVGAEMVKAFISSSEYRQRFGP